MKWMVFELKLDYLYLMKFVVKELFFLVGYFVFAEMVIDSGLLNLEEVLEWFNWFD